MLDNPKLTVSIIIKALNEEDHIAAAVESALAALKGINGEVILADSASTDRTCEIAQHYPIKIVRMTRVEDRSCGAGAQLGYQYSRGRYLCLIDGDMRMRPEFLAQAIRFLDEHPDVAGVGGMSLEHETSNLEYLKRNVAEHAGRQPGIVGRLDGTGVYRRAAVESTGHLTDRNLHGGEELELGARLVAGGWKLARLAVPDVDHYGHTGNAYRLLLRRWTTRMAYGIGEVLRAAIGQRHLPQVLRAQRRTLVMLTLVHMWWCCLLAEPLLAGGLSRGAIVLAALAVLPIAAMSWRFSSLKISVYSVVAWHVYAAGFWAGLLRRRVPPTDWIASTVLQDTAVSDGVRRVGP